LPIYHTYTQYRIAVPREEDERGSWEKGTESLERPEEQGSMMIQREKGGPGKNVKKGR